MELTKLEKAIVVSAIIQSIGEQGIIKYLNKESIQQLNIIFENLLDNTSPKAMREATINVINEIIQDSLK
ncbi:hypothetical protein COF81_19650 [Bacillus pseudomycoides]|uniref:Spore coat protein n=1 Tax=Bacillus pseudomycoides TaxID=64104 RepID=A0ABD6T4E2_9BACI|nr:hypothetical protein [Bacillus pseudomycoides]PHE92475.1 hypothetical protein COF81_19650 [Bacillus pseudomycoides]